MPGDSNIGAWIQFAKLTAAAGELAPFPYIKGVAGCIATVLEVIELAGKNNEDLQDLAESIGTTIKIIKETVEAHGDTSATHFRDVCVELQAYLESLIAKLNITRGNLKSKSIMQFLKTKKVSDVIDGYKQRVNNIKTDYLIRVTTDSRLAISDMRDGLSATVTQTMETAQSHIISTVESQAHCIQGEIHSMGDIQSKHAVQIYEKLQDLKGYYKGQVRELFPGDIYIQNLVSPSRRDSALRYQAIYTGRVECSNTAKIIRVYQHSSDDKEAILKQFSKVADTLIEIKHPNIAQVFGICRSPSFPAIVFHDITEISFYHHERNLTAKQIAPFYIRLFYDLESVAEYLSRHYAHRSHFRGYNADYDQIHLNELGQIVVTASEADSYTIGSYMMAIFDGPGRCIRFWDETKEPLPSQIKRWSSPLTRQKDNLYNAYDAIKRIVWRACFQPLPPPYKPYAPGSVLTSWRGTLVGRVQTRLEEWVVEWKTPDYITTILSFPSTHNGSIMVSLPHVGIKPYGADICLRSFDEILDSWIAQASKFRSCIHSRGHVDNDELTLVDTRFILRVNPKRRHDPFCFCNTFMVEDHHTLSLSISAPSVDYQTSKVSWPVFTWFYDGDSEMSSVEVEEIFGVRLYMHGDIQVPPISKTLLTTVPELNADYGFDPARGGADVCEYFGWSFMEILDVSARDWMPLHGTVSESASVILDDGYRTLNCGSWVFIMMSTAISTILLSFVVQIYM